MLDALNKLKGKLEETPAAATRAAQPQPARAPAAASPDAADALTSISAGVTVVGKITGDGNVKVFGRIEGELHAAAVTICEGAHVEGEVHASELTIGGNLKGTIHASRVRLSSTAVVEGDIFHQSLAIEEDARFIGSSRREEKPAGAATRPAAAPQASPVGAAVSKSGGFDTKVSVAAAT